MKLNRKTLETVLFGGVWVYGPEDMELGRWGKMVFLPNGRIFGYDHPNEYGWDFSRGALRFLRKDGQPTSVFEEASTENDRLLLKGRSLEMPDSHYSLLRVELPEDAIEIPERRNSYAAPAN